MTNNNLTDKGDKEKQIQLSEYRLKQAEESINDTISLLSSKGSPRSIINRAYYAMFYSVLALKVTNKI